MSTFWVETYTICDGWVNCWHTCHEDGTATPLTFATLEDARDEIQDDLEMGRESCLDAGEIFDEEGELEQLRVVEQRDDGTLEHHSPTTD